MDTVTRLRADNKIMQTKIQSVQKLIAELENKIDNGEITDEMMTEVLAFALKRVRDTFGDTRKTERMDAFKMWLMGE